MQNMSIVGEDIAIDAYCACSEVRLCVFFSGVCMMFHTAISAMTVFEAFPMNLRR